jgi:hydrogenase maturation protein HypF
VIGLSLDGTGYGQDGAIWGGEILVADYAGYERLYHLAYVPLPGGDKAIREPWRIALAHLLQAGFTWEADLPPVIYAKQMATNAGDPLDLLQRQITQGLNAPPTSSMGRLFDAVASLLGIRQTANYEAQAAVELEALVDPHENGTYPFSINQQILDPTPMFRAILSDLRAGLLVSTLAGRFHNTIAILLHRACQEIRLKTHNPIKQIHPAFTGRWIHRLPAPPGANQRRWHRSWPGCYRNKSIGFMTISFAYRLIYY